jgi:hypothetical protein
MRPSKWVRANFLAPSALKLPRYLIKTFYLIFILPNVLLPICVSYPDLCATRLIGAVIFVRIEFVLIKTLYLKYLSVLGKIVLKKFNKRG